MVGRGSAAEPTDSQRVTCQRWRLPVLFLEGHVMGWPTGLELGSVRLGCRTNVHRAFTYAGTICLASLASLAYSIQQSSISLYIV